MPRVASKQNFTKADKNQMAEKVHEEYKRRKRERHILEKWMKEVDRQLRLEPDLYYKREANGQAIKGKEWMPELELPNQTQTLEILSADAMRMQAGDPWFSAHVALTDEYLSRVDFQSLIMGDDNDVPSQMNQDNANKLAQGVVDYWHRQYDFWGNLDLINIEAFKYSVGIGRVRDVVRDVFEDQAKGTMKASQRFPVLVPRSLKHTYLDDSEHRQMHEGMMVGPAQIFEATIKKTDVEMAMKAGSSDPNDPDGGWIKSFGDVKPDKNGHVMLLEWEGDFTCQRSRAADLFLPNVIITIACGENANQLIRLRFRKQPYSSYLLFPYHREHIDDPHGSAPLLKGLPMQKAGSDALNRMMMAAALNTEPPVGLDPNDPSADEVGVFPGAVWKSTDKIEVYRDIAKLNDVASVFALLDSKYADVTGGNPARLGAQTLSHTTRFAKEAELQRGTIRTVDYVQQSNRSPLTRLLYMEWEIGRAQWKKQNVYVDAYDGFLTLEKSHLPDTVHFKVFGAAGAAEEAQAQAERAAALQQALQIEQVRAQAMLLAGQTGIQPAVDYDAMIEQTLRQGGWTDVDTFLRRESAVEEITAGPSVDGGAGLPGEPPAAAAIQAAALGGLE